MACMRVPGLTLTETTYISLYLRRSHELQKSSFTNQFNHRLSVVSVLNKHFSKTNGVTTEVRHRPYPGVDGILFRPLCQSAARARGPWRVSAFIPWHGVHVYPAGIRDQIYECTKRTELYCVFISHRRQTGRQFLSRRGACGSLLQ